MRERLEPRPLFSYLCPPSQRENHLSRILVACFARSAPIRRAVMAAVLRQTRWFALDRLRTDQWNAVSQPQSPGSSAARPDVRVYSLRDAADFYIESKVGARVSLPQLRKYKSVGVTRLLLLSARVPEVQKSKLDGIDVKAMRWHQVHEALAHCQLRGQDRLLCDSFCAYLENEEMSSQTALAQKDIAEIARLFRGISTAAVSIGRPVGFDAAWRCVRFLNSVADELVYSYDGLLAARRWGPGYFNLREDGNLSMHGIQVSLYQRHNYFKNRFCIAIYFPQAKSEECQINIFLCRNGEVDDAFDWLQPLSRITEHGELSADAVMRHALRLATKWKVKIK